ncbi:Two pore calcium channel protein 1 [Citrus sinensis]|nr:Two pore calcium channel protein 1 [Citrus sinensis]
MEEDLLVSGEASGNNRNNDNNRRRRGPTALFRRRTDAITRGSPYQKAAALVDLAEDGIGLPEEILDRSSFESSAKFYFIFIKFDYIWSLNYFALIVLNFLEKPLWCAKTGVGTYSCYDREYYYLGQLPYLTGWESLVYEGITLVILIIHTFFPITYEGSPIFWKSTYTRLKVLCLLILVADFLVYGLYLSPIAFDFLPLRIAPYIRVVFFILNIRQLRDTLFVLAGMLGTYLNVLLAKQVSEMDRMRRRTLGKAFNLIDNYNVGFLNKEQCIKLFEELNKYRTLPNISREEFELIFDELDDTHDFKINLDEFADLCNAIALRFQKEDVPSCFENLPSIYHSPFSEKLKAFIRSTKFGYMISIILIVNLVAVIVETTLDIQESSLQSVWQEVEFVFDDFYTFAVIGETITLASPNGQTFLSNGEWIRYLLLARMLRLIRLLMHVQQYRGFVATFLTLIPSLMPYLGTIFCVQCIYCSLGVQVIAFVLEAFFAEMELESSEKCEEEDKDGEPRERRRRVGTKTRSQRVDVLLHHMLSAELQKSCDS